MRSDALSFKLQHFGAGLRNLLQPKWQFTAKLPKSSKYITKTVYDGRWYKDNENILQTKVQFLKKEFLNKNYQYGYKDGGGTFMYKSNGQNCRILLIAHRSVLEIVFAQCVK